MNDTDLLTDRLHHLSDRAPVPPVAPAEDVRRGRGRLRRRRLAAVAGTAAVAVTIGGVALTGGGPGAVTSVDPAAPAAPAAPVAPPAAQDLRSLVDELRVGGVRSGEVGPDDLTVVDLSALAAVIESVHGIERYRHVAIAHAPSWRWAGATDCAAGWTCEPLAIDGARRARTATDGTTSQVVAQFPRSVVIISFSDADDFPAELAYGRTAGTPLRSVGDG
ncbi:hypothetical protein [Pimelobacter simplex]|uniref:hypothetical protein n=1 Tax=Nocardioides simplex TaxID=2045 RepID=UPI003AB02A3B